MTHSFILVFPVNSSELRSISDRVPPSPLRVPASPSRFSLSSSPSRNEPLNLSLEQVIKLTHNFAPDLMIGEGYFGKVYRAQLRDGHIVAIKRAKMVGFIFYFYFFNKKQCWRNDSGCQQAAILEISLFRMTEVFFFK